MNKLDKVCISLTVNELLTNFPALHRYEPKNGEVIEGEEILVSTPDDNLARIVINVTAEGLHVSYDVVENNTVKRLPMLLSVTLLKCVVFESNLVEKEVSRAELNEEPAEETATPKKKYVKPKAEVGRV